MTSEIRTAPLANRKDLDSSQLFTDVLSNTKHYSPFGLTLKRMGTSNAAISKSS